MTRETCLSSDASRVFQERRAAAGKPACQWCCYSSPLLQALTNETASVRRDAAQSLRYMHGAEEAIPALLKRPDDIEPSVRLCAAEALGSMGKQPQLVVPELVRHLSDKANVVRMAVADEIGKFGMLAQEAAGNLKEFQNDSGSLVRWAACNAFERVTGIPTKP